MESASNKSKSVCCTCLSVNRKLYQLCRVKNGVNNLYTLLSYDSEAYREGFYKNTAYLYICWECKALMNKFSTFRKQVCTAQKLFTNIIEDSTDTQNPKLCLSNLICAYKNNYDKCLNTEDDITKDNFIDCGPLLEEIKTGYDSDVPQLCLSNVKCAYKNIYDECLNTEENVTKDNFIDCTPLLEEIKTEYDSDVPLSELCSDRENDTVITESNDIKHEPSANKNKEHNVLNCGSSVKDTVKNGKVLNAKCTRKSRRLKKVKQKKQIKYECKECKTHFQNKNQRWKHMQKYHTQGYVCAECGKKFSLKYNLARHVQNHLAPPPRKPCVTCKKLVRVDHMRSHEATHAERKRYSCVQCEKSFVSKASYEHHLKFTQAHSDTLSNILRHKCQHCGKGYRSGGELRDHINYQHLSKTQHKCPICFKALATPRCITKHVKRLHKGIKESIKDKICQQCGKAFRDKKGLREHCFTHTGERPLSCEICGCTFRQTASLLNHKKRLHNILPKKITCRHIHT